jgi:hypothetical protein
MPDDSLTPEQFMRNIQEWEPDLKLPGTLSSRMAEFGVSPAMAKEMSEAMESCAVATFRYIRLILDYAVDRELARENFLPALLEITEHMQSLRDAGSLYSEVFLRYSEEEKSLLMSDRFDTTYYDAIQGLDIQEFLKEILDEAGPVLDAMALTSAEFQRARMMDLFEQCVRYQMYLKYFLESEARGHEENWSLLFDLYNLFAGSDADSIELLVGDLENLKLDLERIKRLN